MATSDFKVKKGLQVGSGDFNVDIDSNTAAFANGYTITIGSDTVLTDADNVSELTNDANYITLTDLSASGDITYNNSTGVISFTQRTDQQVRNLFSGTGDITYESANGQISFNNTTGYITLTDLSGGTGITYNNATGEFSIAQNIATDQDVTFNTITLTDKILTDTITAVGTGTDVTVDDNLIVSGNLTVNGTTTTLNTATLTVEDLNIVVASGAADAAAANGAGLTIDGADATLTYAATGDKFVMNKTLDTSLIGDVTGDVTGDLTGNVTGDVTGDLTGDVTSTGTSTFATVDVNGGNIDGTIIGATSAAAITGTVINGTIITASTNFAGDLTGNVTGTVSNISNHDTDALSEGSTNLYYTDDRVDARINLQAGANLDLSGVTTDDLAEGSTNLYYTQARFDTAFGNKSTTNLSEGTNLYFTNTRARSAISALGDISYDSSTGVISFTERTDSEVRGLISAGGDLSYDNTTGIISYTSPDDLGDLTNNAGFIKLADLSAGGDLSYNNSSGEFSFTERTDAEVRGLISATGDASYDNSTGVISVTTYKNADADARIALATLDDLADVNYTSAATNGQILVWDNANQYWEPADPYTSTDFDTNFAAKDTDDLTEGSTNQYFTQTRARGSISAGGDLSYNSTTGVISYTTPSNLSDFTNDTNFITLPDLSVTGDLSYNNATGVFSFTERTDTEVRGLISASGDITYNNSTGVISFTERTNAEVRGLISASGDINYNNTTGVISFSNTSGYLTEYTEVDTLDTVTGRGATTSNNIQVGDMTVTGNLSVTGTTTTVNTATLNVADNIVTLNSDVSSAPTENAGIEVERGTSTNVVLRWNETNDKWEFTNDGSTYQVLASSVSELNNDSNYISLSSLSGGTGINYNNSTGEISIDNGGTNFITRSGISATGDISYDNTSGVISFNNSSGYLTSYTEVDTLDTVTGRGSSTSNSAEFGGLTVGGTSVALSNANISIFNNDSAFISRSGISATGNINYDNSTGVISFNNGTGFITSETDTLQSVTDRGNSTDNHVNFNNTVNMTGALTITNEIFTNGIALQTESGANKTNLTMVNGYVKLNYINQLYSDGDLWLANSQQNTSGGDTKKIATANALGTNIAGNNLNIEAGSSTGTAAGGNVIFKTGSTGVSGTATNALSERLKISGADGKITINAAYSLPTSDGTTGQVLVTDGSGSTSFGQIAYSAISGTPTLATVATSGSYNDLTDTPASSSDSDIRALFSASGSLSYDNSTGVFSYTERTDATIRGLISATGDITYNSTTGVISFTQASAPVTSVNTQTGAVVLSTGDISESGSNQYFLASRARNALSVSGDLSYDSATGVISFTQRTNSEVRGLISASGDLSYDNATGIMSFTERTDATIRGLISGTGDIGYDNSTGVISFSNNSGFITTYTETDTLDSVTDRGATTTNNLTVGGLIVSGDLTVSGTTTTINTATLDVADNIITLNSDVTGTPTENAGISINRGVSSAVDIRWNETNDEWEFTNDGTNYQVIAVDTGDLTNTAGFITRTGISASGDLSYDNATGIMSFTERTDATIRGLISASGDLSYDNATGIMSFTQRTDSQVRGLLSASGDLSYDAATGTISFTERTDATIRGLVSGTGDISYNSTTGEFSFNNTSGYITSASITETDTLQSVTSRGSSTTNSISVNDMQVNGNLTVAGTTTTINSTTINLADNIITLNSDFTSGTPTENAGIEVLRGSDSTVSLRWNESLDRWQYTNNGSTYSSFPVNLSDLNNDLSFLALTDISGTGDISFDQSTGVISFNNTSNYLTAEADTLGTVTGRGNTTSSALVVNNSITVQNEIYTQGVALKYSNSANVPQLEIGSDFFRLENNNDFFVESDITLGRAATDSTGGSTKTIASSNGVGTNIAGSTIEIVAGTSTGTAASGSIVFKTGSQGSANNNVTNILQERFKIQGNNGAIRINDAYTLPIADGNSGEFLGTDGSGAATFKQITYSNISGTPSISQVGLTGNYADLNGAPTNVSHFTNDAGYISATGGGFDGDVTGSIFGDDSTLLVDGVNSVLNTSKLSQAGATNGQALVWNNFTLAWEPGTVDGASIDIILDQIGDIDTTGVSNGDYLRWDSIQGKWLPVSPGESSGISTSEAEDLSFTAALIMG
jgi:hypothetical protein